MQRIGGAIIVALCTVGFEDLMPVNLLRIKLIERCGRWRGVAAKGKRIERRG